MGGGSAIKVVLVNKDDEVVGHEDKVKAHQHPVPLHRAISVVIFDKNRQKMLLQQRAKGKPTWPLFWSNAVCTHPLPGESYKDAAERRLEEEMGFGTPLTEVARFTYEANYDDKWGEHEYDVVFEGVYEGKVVPNPEEAEAFEWMNVGELKSDIAKNPNKYTPWFKIILEKLEL